jgi:hypothetical protein
MPSGSRVFFYKFKIKINRMIQADPMNTNQGYGHDNNRYGNQIVPNSVPVLVLGILSITFCWCYGLLSVILAIVALVMSSQGEKQYRLNPGMYTLSSYKNLQAGRTCAIIGLCFAVLTVILVIIYIVVFGTLAINLWNYNNL